MCGWIAPLLFKRDMDFRTFEENADVPQKDVLRWICRL